ncbi:hypothetical protein CEXT_528281 [Caerostris extrusa]|uniref:Uncharacterized protein n=1 Tax=Caerostris extrusa TaxID=172846 RepID=A0AAV4P8T9_CAEEX|nr:hypothetical protein CEXT_528281 [Caerostris extrusa]
MKPATSRKTNSPVENTQRNITPTSFIISWWQNGNTFCTKNRNITSTEKRRDRQKAKTKNYYHLEIYLDRLVLLFYLNVGVQNYETYHKRKTNSPVENIREKHNTYIIYNQLVAKRNTFCTKNRTVTSTEKEEERKRRKAKTKQTHFVKLSLNKRRGRKN